MLSYPNDEYAPLAYFYNADCFFWLQKWDDAANAYQNFYLSFPKHERVPNAMFQKAVCLFRKGAYDDAVDRFQEPSCDRFPDHPLAKEAWLNIALAHKKAFQLDQAVNAYQYVIEHYAADPKINAVWLQMGSLLEVQGKLGDAQRTYAKVPPGTPEYPEALYRQALLAEQRKSVRRSPHAPGTTCARCRRRKMNSAWRRLIKLSEFYEGEGAPAAKLQGALSGSAGLHQGSRSRQTGGAALEGTSNERSTDVTPAEAGAQSKWLWLPAFAGMTAIAVASAVAVVQAEPVAPAGRRQNRVTPDDMEVQIKGQFKGRLLVKKIVAPVTMNLEKLQDFPEDPSQKILLDPLPISQTADFNARGEVKGHAPFVPWIPADS